jgi:ribosomal protein L7Ae-like RNA K-turn-binding protein
MNTARALSLLGLAQRAGKVVSGEQAVARAFRSGKVQLLVLAADAADSSKQNYLALAATAKTRVCQGINKDALGAATGKPPRAALAVTDAGFAKVIYEAMTD